MKALDSWARQYGVSDWDTYIRTGGSIADAARDIRLRIRRLEDALTALSISVHNAVTETEPREPHTIVNPPVIDPDTLARLESDNEPPNPDNAHIQGAEHGEP